MPSSLGLFKPVAGCCFAGGGGGGAYVWQHGFLAAFTRNAAGDYTLNFEEPTPVAEYVVAASIQASIGVNSEPCITYVRPAAGTIRVTTGLNTAGGGAGGTALTDSTFELYILKVQRP